ncbi:MAG: prolipoprotein diacylglyceryl transferase, partial [Oscillospiraceae bacterium]|nr:prolipoprotein diacylglyceryl transferase [Oscillospiraceae bacterium]
MNPIVFPGLGLELNVPRVAFSIGAKEVYWYGIIIACGFILGWLYCYRRAPEFGIRKEDTLDFVLWAAPLGIIGARIYYVLFYLSIYRNADGSFNWGEAVAIWDGGLAIYGGVIAAIITLAVFCRVRKIKFLAFADLGVHGLFIGQLIGRWGNFCNQEAYGSETTLPWRMGLTVGGSYIEVHPTFLYESLWNLVGLALAHFVWRKRRKFDGQLFLFYLAWYGLGRVWIEGLRTDSLYLFGTGIRVSQLLAGLCALIAGGILIVLTIKRKPDPS